MAPHLSIRIVILILLSVTGGTLFGDHLFWISSDHPNARRQCCLVAAESSDLDDLLKLDPGFVGSSWLVPVRLGRW